MFFWLTQLLPYFVFAIYQFSLRSPDPPDPLPAVLCPPGVPFGPVHFTDYPLKSEYKDYTPEKILKLDPLARIQSAVRYNQQGSWIFSIPKLFRGKFNYLSAYNLPMEPPVTPKPMPASSPDLPINHTGKLFGIVYITLTGVIDTIIPAAGPWSWVRKSVSYLFKLALLLWWVLPAKNPAWVTPGNNRLAAQVWIPDTQANGRVEQLNRSPVQVLAKLTTRKPEEWHKHLATALLVCCTQVKRSTRKSPFELIYKTQPNIVQALTGPKLEIPNKIPSRSDPLILHAKIDQKERKGKRNTSKICLSPSKHGTKLATNYG
ncbi:hypothetical protein DSO57_1037500 [Entomophthora muscae]|uniref:Uncharacterized protein n=1 Tax=Entomophthora muscae TaxID=34485 RepID=A0ACC2TKP9_9FUNG|nr:hypothetical protein DSO57_1037500 [Entomophthora muscae]